MGGGLSVFPVSASTNSAPVWNLWSGLLRQGPVEACRQILRNLRVDRRGRHRIGVEDLVGEGGQGLGLEGELAGQALIEHDRQREEVRSTVEFLVANLLG